MVLNGSSANVKQRRQRTLLDLVSGRADKVPDARFQEVFGFAPQGLAVAVVVAEDDPAGAGEH